MRYMRRFSWIVIGLVVAVGATILIASARIDRVPANHPDSRTTTATARKLWHCGMHPQVIQDHPGNCPICGMALTPIDASGDASQPLIVTIEPEIVQNMG